MTAPALRYACLTKETSPCSTSSTASLATFCLILIMLITMICLKLSQGYSRICMYVISARIFLCRGRGNHSKRFYDTKEIPRDSLRHFPFRFCVFSFRFLLQHLTLTLRLTWRARKPKSLILWFRWPVLLLLGRYKCYTCSRGGRWAMVDTFFVSKRVQFAIT